MTDLNENDELDEEIFEEEENYEEIVTEFIVQPEEQEVEEEEEEGLVELKTEENNDTAGGEVGVKRRRHQCDHCVEVFMHRSSLLRHVKAKHRPGLVQGEGGEDVRVGEDPRHQCDTCQKTFRFRTHLVNHINTHSKPYKCGQCEESFAEDTKLASHEINVHGGLLTAAASVQGSLMKCSFCPKVLLLPALLLLWSKFLPPPSFL